MSLAKLAWFIILLYGPLSLASDQCELWDIQFTGIPVSTRPYASAKELPRALLDASEALIVALSSTHWKPISQHDFLKRVKKPRSLLDHPITGLEIDGNARLITTFAGIVSGWQIITPENGQKPYCALQITGPVGQQSLNVHRMRYIHFWSLPEPQSDRALLEELPIVCIELSSSDEQIAMVTLMEIKFKEMVAKDPRWKSVVEEDNELGTSIRHPETLNGKMMVGLQTWDSPSGFVVEVFGGLVSDIRVSMVNERAYYQVDLHGPKNQETFYLSGNFLMYMYHR